MKQSKYTGNFGQQIEMETIIIARADILNTIFCRVADCIPLPSSVDNGKNVVKKKVRTQTETTYAHLTFH